MRIKRLLLIACAAFALPLAAQAQVPSYAQPPVQRQTYSAAGSLAVPQTAAGDAVCISGFASNSAHPAGIVRVKRIELNGIDTTAQSAEADLVMRSTADSGGTSTTGTDVPHASNDGAGAATVKAYTAIPTAGTAIGDLGAAEVFFNTSSALGSSYAWDFNPQYLIQEPTLLGTAQSLCVEFPSAFTTAGPTLKWRVEWTEQ